ncbi:MAG: type II secretion system F family protein [Microthrixaceae bacterium]|nr:type II secretion system F family protein [Microthrixaceae bacterium]
MNGLVVFIAFVTAWVGSVLVLGELPWFRDVSLAQRLRGHVRSGATAPRRSGVLSVESLRDLAAPLATSVGARLARTLGLNDDIETTLRRIGSQDDAASFRLRQFAFAGAAFGATATLTTLLGPPVAIMVSAPLAAAALAYLVTEQRLAHRSAEIQRRIRLELPIVIEQLGMLLGAGHSLAGAVARVGERGQGVTSRGFRSAARRMRHGVDELAALQEFAAQAEVAALDRLVGVLAMNREATDLGALISNEARLVRREVHRDLIETLDRRGQTVWIPVTVATLLPGVVFMAVPFVDAMKQLTGT